MQMVPTVDKVTPDAELPRKADVVVIGGGVIGVSTALFLARKGLKVALCEKGEIAGEQSSRNWGWVRVMGRDKREIPLALESQRLWEQLSAEPGVETGFRRAGIIYVFDTKRMRDTYTAWEEHGREYQVSSRLLSKAELQQMVPGLDRGIDGGLFTPSDARAEPQKAVPALAQMAQRAGATLHTRCAVRGLETAAGRVSGVVTERGRIAADAVLLAGGAWSRLFCGNFGLDLPLLMILGSVSRIGPVEGLPDMTVGGSNFSYRKRLDGGFTVAQRSTSISEITPDSFRLFLDYLPAWQTEWRDLRIRFGKRFGEEWRRKKSWALDEPTPFEEARVLDPKPNAKVIRGGIANLKQAMPVFRDAQMSHAWGGLIDVTPDGVPVISSVSSLPGFFIATGFSGHGFGIGPGAGRLAADLISGDRPLLDPEPYRLDRFARATKSASALKV
jgi:glycine/D-amino acid oxidase-like deaminating enzyme